MARTSRPNPGGPGDVGQPRFILGPVLYFRGEQGDRWRLSALFVIDGNAEPDDLRVDGVGLPVPPRHVAAWRRRTLWRFDFAVPRGAHDSEVTYGFPDGPGPWRLTVPGRGRPPRIAYTSCNGVEDDATLTRHDAPRNALWTRLLDHHRQAPFHLLLQGGDQLYADGVWKECPTLAEWAKRPAPARYSEPLKAAMAEEAMAYYFTRYVKLWRQAEVAEALSRIPSVMMWDDHDVFDGWGSLPDEEMHAKPNRAVYMVARRHFTLFQLGAAPESLPECVWGTDRGTFTQGFRIGDLGILAPDLRSERTAGRILAERTWDALPGWLERFTGCRHLLLMSSVPLVFPDLGRIERLMEMLPGRHALSDDMRDQWRSHAHTVEWRRMVELLSGFSLRTGCRVTVLSGEVHFAARGVLRGGGAEIWQLISSGIVHPPPGRLTGMGMERLLARREAPIDGYTLEMPPFAETGRRMVRARNWLSLEFDARGQLAARWHAESNPAAYVQMI